MNAEPANLAALVQLVNGQDVLEQLKPGSLLAAERAYSEARRKVREADSVLAEAVAQQRATGRFSEPAAVAGARRDLASATSRRDDAHAKRERERQAAEPRIREQLETILAPAIATAMALDRDLEQLAEVARAIEWFCGNNGIRPPRTLDPRILASTAARLRIFAGVEMIEQISSMSAAGLPADAKPQRACWGRAAAGRALRPAAAGIVRKNVAATLGGNRR